MFRQTTLAHDGRSPSLPQIPKKQKRKTGEEDSTVLDGDAVEDWREVMRERNSSSRSKLSAWVPKQIHKEAKILATARDIDLQDLVAIALQHYLTDSGLHGAIATPCIPSSMKTTGDVRTPADEERRAMDHQNDRSRLNCHE
jgi:hypothetical protein